MVPPPLSRCEALKNRFLTIFAWVLIVSGLVLIGVWAYFRLDAHTASRAAIARMPDKRASTASSGSSVPGMGTTALEAGKVDTSLWSDVRIAEFRESLRIGGEPPVAVLSVPRVGVEVAVFPGTDDVTLNRGAGWIKGTAAPGSKGNSGIAAHRDGFFRPLKDIAVGDVIELRTHDGVKTFRVETLTIVDPSNVGVLAPSTESELTLVTCYPFYHVGSAPKRFIVHAVARGDVGG